MGGNSGQAGSFDAVILRKYVVVTKQKVSLDESRPSNLQKDPDDWTTGDEPMTGAQASYLKTLSEEAGEEFDASLTKAEASKRIDSLQQKTGRGR
jgi:hypothetical protein